MYYNLHTHKIEHQPNVLSIVNQYPYEFNETIPFYSIGIHPWYINEQTLDNNLAIIEEKLQFNNCLALGECGLDKRINTDINIQIAVFEKQLALAKKYKKNVILHCVSAYQEIIEVKKRLQIDTPMIVHGFSKNEQMAKMLLDNGFYLSFGKYLLRNPALENVFKTIPNDRFFLETDTIEETIVAVYNKATLIKKIAVEEIVEENFKTIFKTF